MSNKSETRITIRFPSDLVKELRLLAVLEERSINSEVVYAVREYVTRKQKERGKDAKKDL